VINTPRKLPMKGAAMASSNQVGIGNGTARDGFQNRFPVWDDLGMKARAKAR
jgi:hypothetical protein